MINYSIDHRNRVVHTYCTKCNTGAMLDLRYIELGEAIKCTTCMGDKMDKVVNLELTPAEASVTLTSVNTQMERVKKEYEALEKVAKQLCKILDTQ